MQSMLEADWVATDSDGNETAKLDIAEHAAFFLFLYCGSLRGEPRWFCMTYVGR
jgi:hypothetical protein